MPILDRRRSRRLPVVEVQKSAQPLATSNGPRPRRNLRIAINQGITQAAKHYITDKHPTEGVLNRIEAVVRAYDPCFSCATHADGRLALVVAVVAADGSLAERMAR